ncbi:N-acetylmuramic acid 6-phosphate etherase [Gloeocapsa sp. PCC 73106]|uniref:N-acetylmuramic acid 6-phosphate etherase n=1 Tax=Gloeocapsa sp. PCC 73106 TaxID=102232 RepID=UPI0002ACF416|nr:N-acetylmuramic acid 6-phosphate etherase [Gloeocapsa sp. PCC 73106]ELR97331.1 N-acetylmuramic acid 6-phosphate etherase [Gloeocapsa sp. PCC 73106]
MNQPQPRGHLLTELVNPRSSNLDQLTSLELVDLFNQEDQRTIDAIAGARVALSRAIEMISASLSQGGRLFYVGAGTSGRLGVLDAAECPPTFCTSPEMVQAIIAGGTEALVRSSEAAEDQATEGVAAINAKSVTDLDVVMGITAGGTTPFVQGAIAGAQSRGAKTIFLTCVPEEQVSLEVDIAIRLLTGPELIAGSTRLKAGTATKMALNIISTGVMVRLGKVYANRMVDVAVTNQKLRDRALRIIEDLTGLNREQGEYYLNLSQKNVKLALLLQATNLSPEAGASLLAQYQGNLRQALQADQSNNV